MRNNHSVPDLTGADSSWRPSALAYPAALTLILTISFVCFPSIMLLDSDVQQYRDIASGNISAVVAPFSSRALIPLAVGFLSRSFGFSIDVGFAIVAVASFFIFTMSILDITRRRAVQGRLYLTLLLMSSPLMQFVVADMPDPVSAALIAASLALLAAERVAPAAMLAGAAIAVREANLVFLVAVAIFFVAERRWLPLILALLVGGAAFLLTRVFGSWGAPNVHFMSPTLYMALKIPVNFFAQVLGFPLWTDGFSWCEPPIMTASLPSILPTGNIHAIGLCSWQPEIPLRNLAILLSVFGILPSIFFVARHGLRTTNDRWLKLVALYGLCMIVLGLCSGWTVGRLVSYGWPLFGICLPIIWSQRIGKPIPAIGLLPQVLIFPIYLMLMTGGIPSNVGILGTVIFGLFAMQIFSSRLWGRAARN